jgi:hypothetical protein
MTGLVRKATLFAMCGLLAAGVAMAHVPDPTKCECPPDGWIYVVGHDGNCNDGVGAFCVTIRDFNQLPIENASVVIDFSACDLQLCIDQLNCVDPDPLRPTFVDCNSQTVRRLTNAAGQACFSISGKSRDGLGCGGAAPGCVKVYADGVFICALSAPTFDLVNDADGSGLGAGDLSNWLTLFFCGNSPIRGDYICDGSVGADDLSKWLTVFFGAGSVLNCPPPKDPQVGPKCP